VAVGVAVFAVVVATGVAVVDVPQLQSLSSGQDAFLQYPLLQKRPELQLVLLPHVPLQEFGAPDVVGVTVGVDVAVEVGVTVGVDVAVEVGVTVGVAVDVDKVKLRLQVLVFPVAVGTGVEVSPFDDPPEHVPLASGYGGVELPFEYIHVPWLEHCNPAIPPHVSPAAFGTLLGAFGEIDTCLNW
jgi:hypothetical protein